MDGPGIRCHRKQTVLGDTFHIFVTLPARIIIATQLVRQVSNLNCHLKLIEAKASDHECLSFMDENITTTDRMHRT
jgi:hypothetical protein